MSYAAALKALLTADATLTATLTGGLYTYLETRRLGINRVTTPAAFATGVLKPTALIKDRALIPTGDIADADGQYMTTSQVIEIWLYNDGDAGYAPLQTASARIYALLHNNRLPNTFEMRWAQDIEGITAPELDEAALLRTDYQIIGSRKTA